MANQPLAPLRTNRLLNRGGTSDLPVPLSSVREFIGLDSEDDSQDTLVLPLVDGALDLIGKWIGEPLFATLIDDYFTGWNEGGYLLTGDPNMASATNRLSVYYIEDGSKEETQLSDSTFTYDHTSLNAMVRIDSAVQPALHTALFSAPIRVSYSALPFAANEYGIDAIRSCVKLYVTQLYPIAPGEPLPDMVKVDRMFGQLLHPFRVKRLS